MLQSVLTDIHKEVLYQLNNDISGNGLGVTGGETTIEDCKALCESTYGCIAFMYGSALSTDTSMKCELADSVVTNNNHGENFRFCIRDPCNQRHFFLLYVYSKSKHAKSTE